MNTDQATRAFALFAPKAARGHAMTLAALVLLALLAACAGGAPGSVDISSTRPIGTDRGYALSSVNAFRAAKGLGPLTYSSRLDQAAERQARAMAARGSMSHSVEGALSKRVAVYGYDWGAVAENIAYGYANTPAAMTGWKASSGHAKNILNPRVTEMGFAAATGSDGVPYWAMIFGTEVKRRLR